VIGLVADYSCQQNVTAEQSYQPHEQHSVAAAAAAVGAVALAVELGQLLSEAAINAVWRLVDAVLTSTTV
jgi:hypothetical protein